MSPHLSQRSQLKISTLLTRRGGVLVVGDVPPSLAHPQDKSGMSHEWDLTRRYAHAHPFAHRQAEAPTVLSCVLVSSSLSGGPSDSSPPFLMYLRWKYYIGAVMSEERLVVWNVIYRFSSISLSRLEGEGKTGMRERK